MVGGGGKREKFKKNQDACGKGNNTAKKHVGCSESVVGIYALNITKTKQARHSQTKGSSQHEMTSQFNIIYYARIYWKVKVCFKCFNLLLLL